MDYAEKYKRMRNRIDTEVKKKTVVKDAVKLPEHMPPRAVQAERDPTQDLLNQIDKKHRQMNRAKSSNKPKKSQTKENKPAE